MAEDEDSGRSTEISDKERIELLREVEYIQARATERDSRVVTMSDLLLFSTRSGDAWLLDTSDRLAMRVADEGKAVEVTIDAKDDSFAIRWPGRYRIDGLKFIFVDEKSGWPESFADYPTQQISSKTNKETSPLLAADRDTLDLLRQMRKQTGRE